MSVKQVIVMRKKFPDGNGGMRKLRTGKMIAQGAHASMKAIINKMFRYDAISDMDLYESYKRSELQWHELKLRIDNGSPMDEWINGSFTKVCVGVDTEEELMELYTKASSARLPCAIIEDSGLTEFNGVPTRTCIAIGPARSEDIDPITGHLSLL